MSGLSYPCVCCHKVAVDEYHWWYEDSVYSPPIEIVWKLCEECCEFAVSMVELFSNIEEEMVAWTHEQNQP